MVTRSLPKEGMASQTSARLAGATQAGERAPAPRLQQRLDGGDDGQVEGHQREEGHPCGRRAQLALPPPPPAARRAGGQVTLTTRAEIFARCQAHVEDMHGGVHTVRLYCTQRFVGLQAGQKRACVSAAGARGCGRPACHPPRTRARNSAPEVAPDHVVRARRRLGQPRAPVVMQHGCAGNGLRSLSGDSALPARRALSGVLCEHARRGGAGTGPSPAGAAGPCNARCHARTRLRPRA